MTYYDKLHKTLIILGDKIFLHKLWFTILSFVIPVEALVIIELTGAKVNPGYYIALAVAPLLYYQICGAFLHLVDKQYRSLIAYHKEVLEITLSLKNLMYREYNAVTGRAKYGLFKAHLDAENKNPIFVFHRLCILMIKENREVHVVLFLRDNKVVKTYSLIGSKHRVRPTFGNADHHHIIQRFKPDSILVYHNHLTVSGKTDPSPADYSYSNTINMEYPNQAIYEHIVFWNQILEWKIGQYSHKSPKLETIYEYDIAERHGLVKEFSPLLRMYYEREAKHK